MKKIDIKNQLIIDRNRYVMLANWQNEESQECGDHNYKRAEEYAVKANVVEEILYHAFDYKFDAPIYTRWINEDLIKMDSDRWNDSSNFRQFFISRNEHEKLVNEYLA